MSELGAVIHEQDFAIFDIAVHNLGRQRRFFEGICLAVTPLFACDAFEPLRRTHERFFDPFTVYSAGYRTSRVCELAVQQYFDNRANQGGA